MAPVLTVAGRVFEFARQRSGWSGENPVRLLDRSERPRSDQKERRVLRGEELDRLLACAEDQYRPIFAVAAATGTRLGETLGLRWGSIDLDSGTVSITHQVDRRGDYVELKTKRSRRVLDGVAGSLVSLLRARKLASPCSRDIDFIFCSEQGTPLDHRNVGGRALSRAINAAELDLPKPTFHSFRHTFASAWIADGGDLVTLSAYLGHANPSITASTYCHEFEKASRSVERQARLDRIFGNALETTGGSPGQQNATLLIP